MQAERVADVAEVCKMLADPTRATIVAILAKSPTSPGALRRELELRQAITSHHLGLLRMTGLVRRGRKGRQVLYSLNRDKLKPVKKFLAKLQ
ncbi:MAG: hypothetical protein AMS16_05645 [Planctomycetes bacterium DG_58]|nr:MAG: hypothetical protein AMS16_05645 [Planctomycetes bacterium DG_58]